MRRQNKHNVNRRTRLNVEALEARRLMSVNADFNGDGFDDLAVGVPYEAIGTIQNAGAVHIIYGSPSGLLATKNQFWTQDSPGIQDESEENDTFGASLAGGDFNKDGFADLAIGHPGEGVGAGLDRAGAVTLLYGSSDGLTDAGSRTFHQNSPRIREIAEADDYFGTSLATGDFNKDSFTDLAIGVPFEDHGGLTDAGSVHILYGGGGGISGPGNQQWTLDSGGMPGVAAAIDAFGYSLAAGDFNADGGDDLAIGIMLSDDQAFNGGAVAVMYAGPLGLLPPGSQLLHQNTPDVPDVAEPGDGFGASIAAGDFNGDGVADLAICAIGEIIGSVIAGAVNVVYGSAEKGLTGDNGQFFSQDDLDTTDGNEHNDGFGGELTAGDLDGDGRDELAIGTRLENVGSITHAGTVTFIYGSATGLDLTANKTLIQEDLGLGGVSEHTDRFGAALGFGDFDGDSRFDLVIGVPEEDIGTFQFGGQVYVMYGDAPNQLWDQDSPGILDAMEAGDGFGGGLDGGAGGKSAPGGGSGRQDLAQLVSADFELESLLTKPNKRRLLSGRR